MPLNCVQSYLQLGPKDNSNHLCSKSNSKANIQPQQDGGNTGHNPDSLNGMTQWAHNYTSNYSLSLFSILLGKYSSIKYSPTRIPVVYELIIAVMYPSARLILYVTHLGNVSQFFCETLLFRLYAGKWFFEWQSQVAIILMLQNMCFSKYRVILAHLSLQHPFGR